MPNNMLYAVVLIVCLLVVSSFYDMVPFMRSAGTSCLQYSTEGRVVVLMIVFVFTLMNKYLGALAVVLLLFRFDKLLETDQITDIYNCSVIDNKVSIDSSVKKRIQDKIGIDKNNVLPYTGAFSSVMTNLASGGPETMPPLDASCLSDVKFL